MKCLLYHDIPFCRTSQVTTFPHFPSNVPLSLIPKALAPYAQSVEEDMVEFNKIQADVKKCLEENSSSLANDLWEGTMKHFNDDAWKEWFVFIFGTKVLKFLCLESFIYMVFSTFLCSYTSALSLVAWKSKLLLFSSLTRTNGGNVMDDSFK